MVAAHKDQENHDRDDSRTFSRDKSTQVPASAEPLDALDLRLIDTFPASDAIAQY